MKIIIIQIFISSLLFAQNSEFHSLKNIKLFADFLFCEKDYLRAVSEYEKYLESSASDTILFKIALAYSSMDDETNAFDKFNMISNVSQLYEISQIEKLKSLFKQKLFSQLYSDADVIINSQSHYSGIAHKILNLSFLLDDKILPSEGLFLKPFDKNEISFANNLYLRKVDPEYKSEVVAGIYSTLIPGLGKIYTENYGDGITSFLLTGLFAYLAYTNFENDHTTRAWIFAALGAGFYAGNVYGSVASAQIFNARIDFDFINDVTFFIKENNYFIPQYDFCK